MKPEIQKGIPRKNNMWKEIFLKMKIEDSFFIPDKSSSFAPTLRKFLPEHMKIQISKDGEGIRVGRIQ